jgi:hypothetical protein
MMGYRLEVKKSVELVKAVIELFSGNAHLSLEGQLKGKDFSFVEGIVTEPNEILKRNTLEPQQDFVILPVEVETKEVIKQKILPQVGLRQNVYHVLMEKEGELVFAAYDNFHPDTVLITGEVPRSWLEELLQQQVIKNFEEVN